MTVERFRLDGFLDDRLFAALFVESRCKAVGDARLVAELVQRGVERTIATAAVAEAGNEEQRLERAIEKLFDARSGISYPSAARSLERMGFPAPRIYRALRAHAASFGPLCTGSIEEQHADRA